MSEELKNDCPCGCGDIVKPGNKFSSPGCARRGKTTSPELRNLFSEQQKRRWAEPGQKEIQSEKTESRYKDPIYREKMSRIQNDPENKARHQKATKEAFQSPEVREGLSERSKALWANPESRSKMGIGLGKLNSEETIQKRTETIRKNYEDPDFKARMKEIHRIAREKRILQPTPTNKEPNNLERLVQKLSPNNVVFTGNGAYWIRAEGEPNARNPDFIVLSNSLIEARKTGTPINELRTSAVIEAFGDYWHSSRFTGKDKDAHEKEVIEYYAKAGVTCLVIWESAIHKCPEETSKRIIEFIKYWSKWKVNLIPSSLFELYYST